MVSGGRARRLSGVSRARDWMAGPPKLTNCCISSGVISSARVMFSPAADSPCTKASGSWAGSGVGSTMGVGTAVGSAVGAGAGSSSPAGATRSCGSSWPPLTVTRLMSLMPSSWGRSSVSTRALSSGRVRSGEETLAITTGRSLRLKLRIWGASTPAGKSTVSAAARMSSTMAS